MSSKTYTSDTTVVGSITLSNDCSASKTENELLSSEVTMWKRIAGLCWSVLLRVRSEAGLDPVRLLQDEIEDRHAQAEMEIRADEIIRQLEENKDTI